MSVSVSVIPSILRIHRQLRVLDQAYMDAESKKQVQNAMEAKLDELHVKHASQVYLKAKRELAITRQEIPQLRLLSERAQKETNMHLVPAEGALPYRTYS